MTRSWRYRIDGRAIVLVLLCASALVLWWITRTDDVAPMVPPLPSATAPPIVAAVPTPTLEPQAEPEAVSDLRRIEAKAATTPKGRLLKEALKQRAQQRVAMASAGIEVELSGDAGLRRALIQQLTGASVTTNPQRGFALSLKNEHGKTTGGAVYARCSVAIAQLPSRKLLASLSTRADVDGEGVTDAELEHDAAQACAAALATDVSSWLRAHR